MSYTSDAPASSRSSSRGARDLGDQHDQNKWVSPIMKRLQASKVQPLFAQL